MIFLTQEATLATENSISLFSMIIKGGWLMLPIFALSVISVYIYAERYNIIRKIRKDNNPLLLSIRELLKTKEYDEAIMTCERENSPTSRTFAKAIQHISLPNNELRHNLEASSNREINKLEKGLSMLSTASGLAPMIGFLGTVVGMVQAFYDMALAGSNINITLLSRGIYTAMITTVAGLLVGIIAYVAYNTLTSMINRIASRMESDNAEFMEIVYEIKK